MGDERSSLRAVWSAMGDDGQAAVFTMFAGAAVAAVGALVAWGVGGMFFSLGLSAQAVAIYMMLTAPKE